MSDSWYVARDGRAEGPVPFADLRAMLAAGHLSMNDMVRDGAAGTWISAAALPGLVSPTVGPPVTTAGGWEYLWEETPTGPIPFAQLAKMVGSGFLTPDAMVRPSGGEWASAGTVPGLGSPPRAAIDEREVDQEWERLRVISRRQQVLNIVAMFAVAAATAVGVASRNTEVSAGPGATQPLLPAMVALQLGQLATIAAAAGWLASALGRSPALWGILGAVPGVNLIVWLLLSARANAALRADGIPVGLFGASVPDRRPTTADPAADPDWRIPLAVAVWVAMCPGVVLATRWAGVGVPDWAVALEFPTVR